MKSVFREFFNNEKVDFHKLDESTLIVLDTNILLNIYRFSKDTRDTFFSSLEAVKSNLWIPYQIGLEFNLNRRKIMEEVKNQKDKTSNKVDNLKKGFFDDVKKELDNYPIKSTDGSKVRKDIIDTFKRNLDKIVEDFFNEEFSKLDNLIDKTEDKMNILVNYYEGKVGTSFTQSEIDKICEEGEKRFKDKIPPGFEDSSKKDTTHYNGLSFPNKYGDLIAWKQIILQAKQEQIKTVIFVTGDNKTDWWYEIKGKKIGARAELKNELRREAEADLIMININSFLRETSSNVRSDLVETYLPKNNVKVSSKYYHQLTNRNIIKSPRKELLGILNLKQKIDKEINDIFNYKQQFLDEPHKLEYLNFIQENFESLKTEVEDLYIKNLKMDGTKSIKFGISYAKLTEKFFFIKQELENFTTGLFGE